MVPSLVVLRGDGKAIHRSLWQHKRPARWLRALKTATTFVTRRWSKENKPRNIIKPSWDVRLAEGDEKSDSTRFDSNHKSIRMIR